MRKPTPTDFSRRDFVGALAGAAAGTVVAPLATLYAPGACFSPNGKFMYVNTQSAGITFAVFRDDHRSIRVHSGWV